MDRPHGQAARLLARGLCHQQLRLSLHGLLPRTQDRAVAHAVSAVRKAAEAPVTSHETRFRVRYAETDQMGVVYYANYLVWMELGRAEFCRAAGIRYKDMEATDGVRLAVVEAHCRY